MPCAVSSTATVSVQYCSYIVFWLSSCKARITLIKHSIYMTVAMNICTSRFSFISIMKSGQHFVKCFCSKEIVLSRGEIIGTSESSLDIICTIVGLCNKLYLFKSLNILSSAEYCLQALLKHGIETVILQRHFGDETEAGTYITKLESLLVELQQ